MARLRSRLTGRRVDTFDLLLGPVTGPGEVSVADIELAWRHQRDEN